MDRLVKDTGKFFWTALIMSILVPFGVLLIVFGAILATWYGWIMLAVGVAICVCGFYVMPIMWVKFGEYKRMQRIAKSITDENVYYIDMLAQRFAVRPNMMCDYVRTLIAKQYIVGYVFNNKRFVMKLQQRTVSVHCPNCGSNVNVYGADGICEHCGTLVKNPNEKVVHVVQADELFYRNVALKECTLYPFVYDEAAQNYIVSDLLKFVNVNSGETIAAEIDAMVFSDTFKKLFKENGAKAFGFTDKERKKVIKYLHNRYGGKEKMYGVIGIRLAKIGEFKV